MRKRVVKACRPANRPKPSPAVSLTFPIDLVPTIYSEECQPVPMKSSTQTILLEHIFLHQIMRYEHQNFYHD